MQKSFVLVLLVCFGCGSGTQVGGTGGAGGGQGTRPGDVDTGIPVPLPYEVDILFLVDNSPSMDPKQQALAASFPALMDVLQNLPDGLPDLHIGVVSSNMGAGAGEMGGNCAWVLGDRGILWGNDPSAGAIATVSGGKTNGCGLNVGARFIKDVRNTDRVGRDMNYTGKLTEIFSCLATAVGVGGCGEEHQLQALRLALSPQGPDPNNPTDTTPDINRLANKDFLRPEALLAIVIVSDEDDCSAEPNSDVNATRNNGGIFVPRMIGDTASLRCAARGHVCDGDGIPNYDWTNGYMGATPLSISFAKCAAKEPKGSDTNWMPLISVQDMITTVEGVKPRPREQILVSGIIGWPDNGDLTGVKYRIDKDPTSVPLAQANLWDYMPICTIPSVKSADGNIYKAYGGLRLKKFIDAFGSNGATYSICNNDFSAAMTQIGTAIANRLSAR